LSGPLRLLLVGEDPLARAGLASTLGEQPGCQIVGQLGPEVPAAEALALYRPEVVIWDLGWSPDPASAVSEGSPLLSYLEAGARVLALLGGSARAAALWAAGARGLLPRPASAAALAAAAGAIAQGMAVVDPAFVDPIPWTPAPLDGRPLEELTAREREVLQLLAEGLPNKSIAQRLDISEHTVKFHVNAILRKLGAQSRTEAVVQATRLGLILL
jgi:DNA-binding NarL/FixJ family response regulator